MIIIIIIIMIIMIIIIIIIIIMTEQHELKGHSSQNYRKSERQLSAILA